jgi:hypothetical protein
VLSPGAPVRALGVTAEITRIGLGEELTAGVGPVVAVALAPPPVSAEQPLSVATTATPTSPSFARIVLPGFPARPSLAESRGLPDRPPGRRLSLSALSRTP